jgi:hypothetical protein
VLVILKASGSITKDIPKAASSHLNRFLKAAGVGIHIQFPAAFKSNTGGFLKNQAEWESAKKKF